MKSITFKVKGVTPVILHNGGMASPLNPYSAKLATISKKRNKTLADFAEISDIEWLGSHYWKEPIEQEKTVTIPARVLQGCLSEAAKKHKLGKDFGRSATCISDGLFEFDGPQDVATRMHDPEFRLTCMVAVQRSRVLRTRPLYNQWAINTWKIEYDETQLDESQITTIMETAGSVTGLGDGRSWVRYGRFNIERIS